MSMPCSDWREIKSWRDGPRSPTGYRGRVFIPIGETGLPWIGNRERSAVKSLLEAKIAQQGREMRRSAPAKTIFISGSGDDFGPRGISGDAPSPFTGTLYSTP